MDSQPPEFFNPLVFKEFATKVINYFKGKYNVSDNFTLYADRNMIMSIKKPEVKTIINHLVDYFNNEELYENSKIVTDIHNGWIEYTKEQEAKPVKKKRGRPRKTKSKKDEK